MAETPNPAAFPQPSFDSFGHAEVSSSAGMALRDWFAGQALLSIGTDYYASGKIDAAAHDHAAGLAEHAYVIADAMLAARGAA